MTETYSAPAPADAIEDEPDTVSSDLVRQADAFLRDNEGRAFGPTTSVRQAIREDAGAIRQWGRGRAEGVRDAVREEPVKASLYALGLGVLIGLLVAR
jgi:ElaB/YqjD/DUF883 family membrane-anchored ribosome-binding protein